LDFFGFEVKMANLGKIVKTVCNLHQIIRICIINNKNDADLFVPVPAFQTPEAMENLCNEFSNAIERAEYDPLLLIPMFIIDFLCIHPFNDGNGR
jgi:Fic family protein